MILAVLVLAVVAIVVAVSRRSRPSGRSPSIARGRVDVSVPGYVDALLDRWQQAGLLQSADVDRIRIFEQGLVQQSPRRTEPARIHVIAEALGYLGGTLGCAGVIVLIAQFWRDFEDAIRLGLPAGACGLLCVFAVVVPESKSSAMVRLRTFLSTLATGAAGAAAWVFAEVILDVTEARTQWLAVGIAVVCVSAVLWAGRVRPVQQFTVLVGFALVIGTSMGEVASIGYAGIALWASAGILLGSSLRGSSMRRTVNVIGSSFGLVVGAFLAAADWRGPGMIFVLVTGALLAAPWSLSGVELRSPIREIMAVIGGLALVQGLPMTLSHFAREAGILTGLVLWVGGGLGLLVVSRRIFRSTLAVQLISGIFLVVGAAIVGVQSDAVATIVGLTTSVALIALGTRSGWAVMSVFGLVGLVAFIPWTIGHFFPGEGRVPILVIISGLLLVGVAVALSRIGGRLRGEILARR